MRLERSGLILEILALVLSHTLNNCVHTILEILALV
jgi:hypothetical protein